MSISLNSCGKTRQRFVLSMTFLRFLSEHKKRKRERVSKREKAKEIYPRYLLFSFGPTRICIFVFGCLSVRTGINLSELNLTSFSLSKTSHRIP